MTKQELENKEPITVRQALEMAFEAGRKREHQYWEGREEKDMYHQGVVDVVASLLRRVEAGSGKAEGRP